ncbi:lanthionine synthetase, partial [Bacillus cereus]
FCLSKILSYYDDSLPMGFKSDDAPIVDLSFVTGIVSILLPLLDLLKSDTNKWDSIFLLS